MQFKFFIIMQTRYNDNWGLEQSGGGGGGCLEKLKIVVFLAIHKSFVYSCGQ